MRDPFVDSGSDLSKIQYGFHFIEGHFIMNALIGIENICTYTSFKLYKNFILIENINKDGCNFHSLLIYTDRIKNYYYDCESSECLGDGESLESPLYKFNILSKTLLKVIRIKKKQELIFYKEKDKSSLTIMIKDSITSLIPSNVPFEPNNENNNLVDDNVYSNLIMRIDAREFSSYCKQIINCQKIRILLINKGIRIEPIDSSNNIPHPFERGEEIDTKLLDKIKNNKIIETEKIIYDLELNKDTIKLFSKLSLFNNQSSYIYIYYEVGYPLKLYTPFNLMGEFCLYFQKIK